MKYEEMYGDLFQVPGDYYLVHCISADFALGKGIAVEFNKRYNMRNRLLQKYTVNGAYPKCYLIDNVFNLVTKDKYWCKPTYTTLRQSLMIMKDICVQNDIKKVAMPTIGCGLDRLEWEKTRQIIFEVFEDIDDFEIKVVMR